jgi:hypothetical protein
VKLEVAAIVPLGGLFSFLGHQVSTLLVCSAWSIPVLKWIVFWANYWCVVRLCALLDSMLRTAEKFPMDLLAVYYVNHSA